MQPPIRHPFALANFQLGRKGQRPKGRKVKRPNFQKLSEAFLIKSKVVPDVFMSIFKLKGPISRNFALELIVGAPTETEKFVKIWAMSCVGNSAVKKYLIAVYSGDLFWTSNLEKNPELS